MNINGDDLEQGDENVIEDLLLNGPGFDANNLFNLLDDSDDDEPRNRQQRTCIQHYVENTVRLYSDREFKSHFRLTRATTYTLIRRFEQTNFLQVNEREDIAITHERAFLMTLWYLANLETFRQIADRFDVARSSSHRVLLHTLDFINSLAGEYIRWPNTEDEKEQISQEFSRIQNFHGVIGAIDGCHVRIKRPMEHEEDYLNRKRYHSVVIQAVATSEKLLTDVYIGEPGSMHDARILRRSPLYELATENPDFFGNYYLLGDSAYPNLAWLLSPFRDNGHLNEAQRLFNYRHSSTRTKIEHTFGLLRGRFRRLIRFDNIRIDIIIDCIMATCILHNICILMNRNHNDDDSDDDNDHSDDDDNDSDSDDNGDDDDADMDDGIDDDDYRNDNAEMENDDVEMENDDVEMENDDGDG